MRKIFFPIVVFIIFLFGLSYLFYQPRLKKEASISSSPQPKTTSFSIKEKRIVLFFSTRGGDFLEREERKIYSSPETWVEIKTTLRELIKGPKKVALDPVLPSTARLLSVYLTETGICYLNFSREFILAHPGGVRGEVITLSALGYTLLENFPAVRAFQVLVEGREIETLKGHLIWDQRYSLAEIKKFIKVKEF